jgi:FSR family fosmidomycin resistance protein-like MFS transporter
MQIAGANNLAREPLQISSPGQCRNLLAACLAHALHDGYTDQLYALLPVWQGQFGLSYAGLAAVRALYSGTMGGLQIPGNRFTRRWNARTALVLSTLVAGLGFLLMALPLGLAGLCIGLVLAGTGSSLQHPRASLLVTDTYGQMSRGPLGIYNFTGDLGKATLPAIVALLLPVLAWRPIVGMMALLGLSMGGSTAQLLTRRWILLSAT